MPSAPKSTTGSSMPDLRLSGIVEESVVDGPGVRFVVFTQGCEHHCPGCHNPHTHALDGGFLMPTDAILSRFDEDPLLSGITFSGGEPFLQPEALAVLAEAVHARGKEVMIYSGFTFEQLLERGEREPAVRRLLEQADVLVEGIRQVMLLPAENLTAKQYASDNLAKENVLHNFIQYFR